MNTNQILDIIGLYETGTSINQLAKKYVVGPGTIAYHLKKCGVYIRHNSKRKFIYDENFFLKIDNELNAYALGFLYADAGMKANFIEIKLARKDHEHLQKIVDLFSDYQIRNYSYKNKNGKIILCCRADIGCTQMVRDLINHGCGLRKGYKIQWQTPNIVPNNLLHHFARGYFDGDGSVYLDRKKYLKIKIISNYKFCDGYQNWLLNFGINKNKICENSNISYFTNQKKQDIIKIYHLLYKNATIYLHRKKNVFEKYCV